MREVKDISLKSWSGCKWRNISSDLLFTGRERVGTDDTTLMERVEPSSFVAAVDRLLVHLSRLASSSDAGSPWVGADQR